MRDNIVKTKPVMDINLISALTVEKLFNFIGMDASVTSNKEIDRRLNSQRIEI